MRDDTYLRGVIYKYIYIFKVSGYDEMVDIGHLRCPGLDRVGSTPTNRNINNIYILTSKDI